MSLNGAISSMITRGKIVAARIAVRTLVQVSGLDNEDFSNVELLLPPGYVALPTAGSDIILLQANGIRDHRLAIAGDSTDDVVTDLAPGEIGLSRNGRRVILRTGYTEIVDPVEIRLVAPLLHWSPDGATFYTLATSQHTHIDSEHGATTPPVATDPGLTG
jgi:phage gp45-like